MSTTHREWGSLIGKLPPGVFHLAHFLRISFTAVLIALQRLDAGLGAVAPVENSMDDALLPREASYGINRALHRRAVDLVYKFIGWIEVNSLVWGHLGRLGRTWR